MRDLLTNANFPRTTDLRVYHLGVRAGEVANRIVTVGCPSRAKTIASFLDESPKPFELSSERGFLTITGRYRTIPVSVISIGMGSPNMDFLVRETRECVNGDMLIVRLGSCGALEDVPVSTVVVPQACVQITRNVDFNFLHPEEGGQPYYISKPVSADTALHDKLLESLRSVKPTSYKLPILGSRVNASADSFYSSQGRQTSFPDNNADLIESVKASVANLATLEMETFHLYHLAACWQEPLSASISDPSAPPITSSPVNPVMSRESNEQPPPSVKRGSVIRAAAAHMVFASRTSQDFITPEAVDQLERWCAQGILDALIKTHISDGQLHEDKGSVWAPN